MAIHSSPNRRTGFTLLEVLLATAIAALLMAGLYVAMNVLLRHVQSGRDSIEHSLLFRGLQARIASDILGSLAPTAPVPTPSSSPPASNQSASNQSATGSTPGTTAAPPASTNTSSPNLFNRGVQGDLTTLTLYVSRVPRDLDSASQPMNTRGLGSSTSRPALGSDLRRISYWLAGSSSEPMGLARQEILATSNDAATPASDIDDPAPYIIAEEVRSLEFHYFDGSAWQDSWDGTAPGSDGVTPKGPPVAISITVSIAPPGSSNRSGDPGSLLKTYRHVVVIPTANGPAQQAP